jgi:fructose-1,6-bisphosphatase/inositol monophosphatase family enzyme
MTNSLLEVVAPALLEARRLTLAKPVRGGTWHKTGTGGAREIVSRVDVLVQQAIVQCLTTAYPQSAIYAEESAGHPTALPDDVFVVDPIDGSAPMLRGESTFSVSISRMRHGRQWESVLYFPSWDMTMHAHGRSCTLSGTVGVRVSADSILVSPGQSQSIAPLLGNLASAAPIVELPTASVKIALVGLGMGRAAVYIPGPGRPGAAIWDYAAAAHVAVSLGATAWDQDGRDLTTEATPHIRGWVVARDPREAAILWERIAGHGNRD